MVAGILAAIAIVSFTDIGFALYAEGSIRMQSVVTFILAVLALFA